MILQRGDESLMTLNIETQLEFTIRKNDLIYLCVLSMIERRGKIILSIQNFRKNWGHRSNRMAFPFLGLYRSKFKVRRANIRVTAWKVLVLFQDLELNFGVFLIARQTLFFDRLLVSRPYLVRNNWIDQRDASFVLPILLLFVLQHEV